LCDVACVAVSVVCVTVIYNVIVDVGGVAGVSAVYIVAMCCTVVDDVVRVAAAVDITVLWQRCWCVVAYAVVVVVFVFVLVI